MAKAETVDAIILSCRLRSGLFESQIEVPLTATRAEMQDFACAWLKLMEAGVKVGQGAKKPCE